MLFSNTGFVGAKTWRVRRAESERIAAMVGHPYPSPLTDDAQPGSLDAQVDGQQEERSSVEPIPIFELPDNLLTEHPRQVLARNTAHDSRLVATKERIFGRITRQCVYSVFMGSLLVAIAHVSLGLPWIALTAYLLGSTATALSVLVVVPYKCRAH